MTMRLVGWAIVHSLWQGGLLVLISAGLLALTRRSRPVVRYAIALATLAAMVVAPVTTAIITANNPDELSYGTASLTSPGADVSPESQSSSHAAPAIDARGAEINTGTVESFTGNSGIVSNWVENSLPFVVAAWMLGLLVASGRLIGGFARTRAVSRKSTSPASHPLEIRLEKLCGRLGITRAIRLLESTNIDVPLVVGALRPVIVVPLSLVTGLTPVQLDMLLAHELAHVRRHDYLINLIQTIFETLLFYHPGARWISERAREERENCCDDIAIEACGVNARDYTETLLVLEEARDQGFGLAAAATGGSLLRRAQRLLSGRPAYLELGPRWMAGVITIGAGLFAGNDAFAAIRAAYLPVISVSANSDSVGKTKRVDTSQAKPSTVIKSPASGSLADRARWAEKNSGSKDYWIGYLIAGDPSGKKYYTSDLPVRLEGNVTMSGSMSFGNGDMSGMVFYGTPLAPLVGEHDPTSTAVFLRMHDGAPGRSVEQIHFGTFSLPGYFANRPLVWLDSATDAESVALLRSVFSNGRDENVRENLVAAIGAHRDANVTVPVLVGILDSRDTEDVRQRAAEAIGHAGDPRAMTILSRTARHDRAEDVRRESIEAFGYMQSPAATDSLIAFVNTVDESDLRRVAIEALGHRGDDRAFNFLARFVKGSDSYDVRREAIESLANMPNSRGMNAVIDIAQHDPSAEMRREAVESIGEMEPASRALDLLRQIVANDRNESVQAEAVETIASVHDRRSVAILADIIEHNSNERVQAEAVESLGETDDPETAVPLLRKIVRDHPVSDARRKALEALISLHDDKSAIEEIVYTIRHDPSEDVRNDAIDALGDSNDAAALKTLESIIDGGDRLDIRQKALEVYADAVSDKQAMAMLKRVAQNDKSSDMRSFAAEMLKDR